MKRFKKHLNWTLAIFSVLATALLILLILVIEWANSEEIALLVAFPNILIVASWLGITGWILTQKNRSLAWLSLSPVPLGWVAILF